MIILAYKSVTGIEFEKDFQDAKGYFLFAYLWDSSYSKEPGKTGMRKIQFERIDNASMNHTPGDIGLF